jgi:hypothetical protein
MSGVTAKGIPILTSSDQGLPTPNVQSYLQTLATALDARIEHVGSSYNANPDSVSSTSYANPSSSFDRVQNIIVPTDGLLVVGFAGLWKVSAASTMGAALFIGANQLKNLNTASGGAPILAEGTNTTAGATSYGFMHSGRQGIGVGSAPATDTTLVNTGMILYEPTTSTDGGLCYISVAAGTYDVSVKYKISTGTLTVKERRLWVHSVQYL